ncbi:MAG: acyl-CoA thioesterase [Myxococcales bacterium]|nr:acyl-CoA thioesterase [Myxococcales bacterium]
MSFRIERAVRFDEIDAAGLVFFPRFLAYCHEAMEDFFGGVDGGYVGLIRDKRVGFPAVHLTTDFRAPLRYGDVAAITLVVTKVGTTSCTFRYEISRAWDGFVVAVAEHVCVCTDLDAMAKLPLPDDVRALLTRHLVTA